MSAVPDLDLGNIDHAGVTYSNVYSKNTNICEVLNEKNRQLEITRAAHIRCLLASAYRRATCSCILCSGMIFLLSALLGFT